jgi:hypothetical protein
MFFIYIAGTYYEAGNGFKFHPDSRERDLSFRVRVLAPNLGWDRKNFLRGKKNPASGETLL